MRPPVARKEDSKLTLPLRYLSSFSSSFSSSHPSLLLSKETKARMKEEAERRRERERERDVLSLKAFVRPSKRHTIRRLRSRTAGGKPTLVSLSLVPFYGGALLPVFGSLATNVKSKSSAQICYRAATWSPP